MASKPLHSPRRLLCEAEAALYVGIGTTKFGQLVAEKTMPMPRMIGTRRVWDIAHLDAAIDDLPIEGADVSDSWADFRNGRAEAQAR